MERKEGKSKGKEEIENNNIQNQPTNRHKGCVKRVIGNGTPIHGTPPTPTPPTLVTPEKSPNIPSNPWMVQLFVNVSSIEILH